MVLVVEARAVLCVLFGRGGSLLQCIAIPVQFTCMPHLGSISICGLQGWQFVDRELEVRVASVDCVHDAYWSSEGGETGMRSTLARHM